MYKKVKNYALQNNLTIDEKGGLAYGQFNGIFLAIHQDPATPAKHTVQIWVKPGRTEPAPAIPAFLTQCTSKHQYLQSATYAGGRVTAEFQGLGFKWGKNYVPCLDAFLREITAYCNDNGLVISCESCDACEDLSLYLIDGVSHLFCPACYTGVSDKIRKDINEKKRGGSGNLAGGLVGAFLGSLLGVALWVLIYQLGYISAIGGAVMIVCAMKGYEMLGGRLNTTGIVISCVLSVLMLIFAEQLSLGIEIYKSYKDYGVTFFEAFQSVPAFLDEPEIRTAVIRDVVIGYVLMAVGAWGTVRQALKAGSGKQDVKKLTPVAGNSTTLR